MARAVSTIIRIIYLACAVIVGWFGVRYAGEAMADRNNAAAYWCIAATGLIVACLIDWAIERRRA